MPRVPLKKLIIQPAHYIIRYAQSACHSMCHISKYAQLDGGSFGEKKITRTKSKPKMVYITGVVSQNSPVLTLTIRKNLI